MSYEPSPKRREPWEPTREFWLSDPRSVQLREVSIAVANRLLALLHDPEVMLDPDRQHELYTELEGLNGGLIELGVTADMQTLLPVEVYKTDPVVASEWIAGQLITFLGQRVVSVEEALPTIREFVEGQFGVLENEPTDKMNKHFDTSMIVGGMRTLLDPTDEELSEL